MKKIRVGVIGCGRISAVYKEAFLKIPGIQVVYAVDKELERARNFASPFHCGFSDRLEDLLCRDLDAIHVLTPHFLHKEHVIACLRAGFHVLTEKPIAIYPTDADDMIRAAKESGRQLGVVFQNRYIEGVREAWRLIREGAFGKLTGAWSTLHWWRPLSYYECDWKGSWEKEGGGVVIDQAIHSLDLVRYLCGAQSASVQAYIGRRVLTNIGVEDVADAAIVFDNGMTYSFFATNYYVENSPIQIEIKGEKGTFHLTDTSATITLDNQAPYTIDSSRDAQNPGQSYWGRHHAVQIAEFYDCLLNGRPVPVDPGDAKATLSLVQGIYRSAKENKKVEVDLRW